jgi:antitoxin component YwqK of YwqJK toxin-antitoxin module
VVSISLRPHFANSRFALSALSLFSGLLACASSSDAQESLFRTPSFKTAPNSAATDDPRSAMTSISHRFVDLEIKQDPAREQQDSIEAWLIQDEQLPVDNSLEDAEEIIPEVSDSYRNGRKGREIIIQRYPDGKPQIEREVNQDEEGNYVNDGFWRVFSQQGERVAIAQGQYQRGKMEGIWMRKHAKDSSGLFQTRPFTMFEGPFTSIATFKDNKLDGLWTLQDKSNEKMFEVAYRDGQRHGTASWWYPSQVKMREVTFVNGLIHGRLREWDEQKKLIRDEEYVQGQRVIRNVTYYRPQQMETENFFLDAKLEADGNDDWWRAEPARLVSTGSRIQHGPVNFWYDNGLPKMKGNYVQGNRDGRFTWWHSNGNKQLDGMFTQGQKIGRWTWWHSSGMKACQGAYEDDSPVGVWTWWNENGQVEDRKEFENALRTDGNSQNDTVLESGGQENPEELPDGNKPGSGRLESTAPSEQSTSGDEMTLELDDLESFQPKQSPTAPSTENSETPDKPSPPSSSQRSGSLLDDPALSLETRQDEELPLVDFLGIED